MKIRENTNHEALNDEALDLVAGGFWDDGGCTTSTFLADLLKRVLHLPKSTGPIAH